MTVQALPHNYQFVTLPTGPEQEVEPPSLEQVFLTLMADRMAEKRLEYGPLELRFPVQVNALDTAIDRIQAYVDTGNTAHLIDASNFIMIEFVRSSHPHAHMTPLLPGQTPEQILRDEV